MEEIDEILNFLLKNKSDDRISIYKKMKYGYRHYHIDFEIDEENRTSKSYYTDHISIEIDNRNNCITMSSPYIENKTSSILLENKDLVDKWSSILEEEIDKNLSSNIKNIFEKSLSSCFRKDIYRSYQMRKILGDDDLDENQSSSIG